MKNRSGILWTKLYLAVSCARCVTVGQCQSLSHVMFLLQLVVAVADHYISFTATNRVLAACLAIRWHDRLGHYPPMNFVDSIAPLRFDIIKVLVVGAIIHTSNSNSLMLVIKHHEVRCSTWERLLFSL